MKLDQAKISLAGHLVRPCTSENIFETHNYKSMLSQRKQPTFSYGWFPHEMTSEKRVQKFHTDDVWLLGSASDWMKASKFLTNQKHYPDLGSEASSVWDFCACFSDIITQGNHQWCLEMSGVFLG